MSKFTSSNNLDYDELKNALQGVSPKKVQASGPNFERFASQEIAEEVGLEYQLDGYQVRISENSIQKNTPIEIPVRNIPNFNEIKAHGSLIYETEEIIDNKKESVLWHLRQANNERYLVQGKVLRRKTAAPVNRIRLAGTDVVNFIQYSNLSKNLPIEQDKSNYYLPKNIDCNKLQTDIIRSGFDVILVRE